MNRFHPERSEGSLFLCKIVASIVFSSASLLAQEVSLRVLVRHDSQPIAAAKVAINDAEHATAADGTVAISLPPGEYELTVTAGEYIPQTRKVTLEAGKPQELTFDLEVAEEEITVSATRTGARLDDQPIRVEVLEREEVEEKMLMTPGDIVMMLNEMGGMRVQSTSPSLGAASVRVQGMKGRYTRFLSDGLPLYGSVGGLGLLQIPPMDLGQVEVIKGVASALYGSGAMGGVVNLVSRPTYKKTADFLLNASTLGATDAIFFGAAPFNSRWSGSLLGGAHFQVKRDMDDDDWADVAGYSRGILRPRLAWSNDAGSSAFFTFGFTYEDRNGGTMGTSFPAQIGQSYFETLDTQGYDLGASYQFVVENKYFVSFKAAGAVKRHDHLFGDARERDSHETSFLEATVRRTFDRHTLVAGAALETDRFCPFDTPQFRHTHVVPGFFLQDDVTLASWISISASGRVDHHNRYGTFFSPRLSVLLRKENWNSRLSIGQGFFAPTALTEETEAAGLTRLAIPIALKAEKGTSASFDLTRTQGIASFTFTAFGSKVSDPIRVERETSFTLLNEGRAARNAGIELLGSLRPGEFSLTASYAYVRSINYENGVQVQTELTPRHSAGVVGMWENEEHGRVGVEMYYTGKQRLEANPFRSESRPYVSFGALVEKKFGKWRLFLNAENLGNVRQTRWDRLVRPTRSFDGRWTVDAWAPLDGRAFNGGVRWSF